MEGLESTRRETYQNTKPWAKEGGDGGVRGDAGGKTFESKTRLRPPCRSLDGRDLELSRHLQKREGRIFEPVYSTDFRGKFLPGGTLGSRKRVSLNFGDAAAGLGGGCLVSPPRCLGLWPRRIVVVATIKTNHSSPV